MKQRVAITAEILRHPRTPWYVRALAFLLVAYAASPIDLIPDFIPVLGYLDDLVLLPLGIIVVIRLTPADVRIEAARAAIRAPGRGRHPKRWVAVAIVAALWIGGIAIVARWIVRLVWG